MNNTITVNYITKIEKIEPIFLNFLNNIPQKLHHKYYNNDLSKNIKKHISQNIILFNEKNIKIANFLLNKYLNCYLFNNNLPNYWNICITKNNFMFSFPFTLDNIIFLPYSYILNSIENNNNEEYITTLIHEKIHIYQRYNLNFWDTIIQKYTNWKILEKKYLFNNENITYNPDTLYPNKQYYYFLNNNFYIGYLNNSIKLEWVDTDSGKLYNSDKLPKYEHPYEEYAYRISKDIVGRYYINK
jgi:hypothetical protein